MITEADICREFVTPRLIEAGWSASPLAIGEQRILKAYPREAYTFSSHFIRISFPISPGAMELEREVTREPTVNNQGLVESQQQILLMLGKNPRISKPEMADSIGISATAIDKNIDALKGKDCYGASALKRLATERFWRMPMNKQIAHILEKLFQKKEA